MTQPDPGFYASLPQKRVAAGALFLDEVGRVLLVDPVYKDPWEIPGGSVEMGESPLTACRREVREELGLDLPILRLLGIDHSPAASPRTEALLFVFLGGVLRADDTQALKLPADELRGFAFFEPDAIADVLTRRMTRRIQACLAAIDAGSVAYLEDGRPSPSLS